MSPFAHFGSCKQNVIMSSSLPQALIIILIILLTFTSSFQASDMDYYNEKAYYEYAQEYEGNLKSRDLIPDMNIADSDYADDPEKDGEMSNDEVTEIKVESYADMAIRLRCDNPWFWNAIKCTWADVKGNMVGERTKKNAKTSAIFAGTILAIILSWLCGFYCIYLLKVKKRFELNKLRKLYAPGRIQLPNGKVGKFQPTKEENKAYEELIRAIIIQEMM